LIRPSATMTLGSASREASDHIRPKLSSDSSDAQTLI
jgi:hypothetical protein